MATLSQSAQKDIQDTAKRAKQAAEDTSQTIREVAQEAGSNVREFFSAKSEQAAELRKTTEDKIAHNPLKSVALAALGGVVLGALLRR